jgi:hypothetical protein
MYSKRRLFEMFRKYRTDKAHLHHYEAMYEDVFKRVPTPKRIAEIGVQKGYSIAAWKALFPEAEITGVDITLEKCNDVARAGCVLVEGDSRKAEIVDKLPGLYDVIIDDGDHRPDAMWATYLNLQDKWVGAYVIEDVLGKDRLNIMLKRFKSQPDRPYLSVWDSSLKNAPFKENGIDKTIDTYAIVLTR